MAKANPKMIKIVSTCVVYKELKKLKKGQSFQKREELSYVLVISLVSDVTGIRELLGVNSNVFKLCTVFFQPHK